MNAYKSLYNVPNACLKALAFNNDAVQQEQEWMAAEWKVATLTWTRVKLLPPEALSDVQEPFQVKI